MNDCDKKAAAVKQGFRTPIDQSLEDSMREIGIPPRPAILDRIAAEMRGPDPDFNHLAALISADVGLSAGLLKTANSAWFGHHARARTVLQALMILGLDVASRAVAGLILRKIFQGLPVMERFWDASARIARTSGWLVQQLGSADGVAPDEAYTFGLFRDCGLPILMRRFPDYVSVLGEANADAERIFTAVEQAHYPTNHALIGSLLAQNWWLPGETCLAIRHHHDPLALKVGEAGVAPASARLMAVSHFAEFLVERIAGRSRSQEWSKLGVPTRQLLQLDEADVETFLNQAKTVVNDLLA
jgi:HD-like signal output (HDOD) protein